MSPITVSTTLPEWVIRDLEDALATRDTGEVKVPIRQGTVLPLIVSLHKGAPPAPLAGPAVCPECLKPMREHDRGRKYTCEACERTWTAWEYQNVVLAAERAAGHQTMRRPLTGGR